MSFLEDSDMLIRETLKRYDCLGVYSRKYKQEYRVERTGQKQNGENLRKTKLPETTASTVCIRADMRYREQRYEI